MKNILWWVVGAMIAGAVGVFIWMKKRNSAMTKASSSGSVSLGVDVSADGDVSVGLGVDE